MSKFSQILSESLRRNPLVGILLSVILFFSAQMLLVGLIAPMVGIPFGINSEQIIDILSGNLEGIPHSFTFFRLIQFLNQVVVWGLPAVLMASLLGPVETVLVLGAPRPRWLPLLAVVTMIASVPLVQWLYLPAEALQFPESLAWLEEMLKEQEEISEKALMGMFRQEGAGILVLNLAVFALMPAICEEFFFRGYLLSHARSSWGVHVSVWLVAALFSLVHFQALGFFSRMILGGFLGYFVVYGNSIWASVAAHFAFNGTAILAQVFAPVTEAGTPIEATPEQQRPIWYLALLSAMATAWLLTRYQQVASSPQSDPSV
ncbi:MAG: CPBP family intramembrane metalloprotease [Bacteroidia bacterium]|nr:CPBP family intramembrane metalloprotease [Bacteroidia bacterium]